jgi:D-serine deaminase-like pyridoxal phosphate-dependent protein
MTIISPIGRSKADLDTPALIVDLDIMEANIRRIATTCRANGVSWRPHIKGQKVIEIARKELEAGAIGVTCAKVGEAEVMVAGGISNILIANQIVGRIKVARLVALLDRADVIVAVDSVENVAELSGAAAGHERPLRVVIEVNLGMNRAGVAPGAPVVALAAAIAASPGLRFAGVMGWESQAVTVADPTRKVRIIEEAIAQLTASADACRKAGYPVEIVSCGGTGTFPTSILQHGVTEVQVGGGIFSDQRYRTSYHVDLPCALTVLATVTSRPTPTRVVLDAGKKSMSCDAAMPEPVGLPGIREIRLSAEHATIELEAPSETPRIGDRVEFLAGYGDTTVHLHEEIVAMRGGRLEAVWPVVARGKIK